MARTAARVRLGFDLALVVVVATATWQAQGFSAEARWFPLYVGVAGTALALANLARDLVRYRAGHDIVASQDLEAGLRELAAGTGDEAAGDEDAARGESRPGPSTALSWLAMLLGYVALIAVLGYILATAVWLPLFLRLKSRRSVPFTVVSTVVAVVVLIGLGVYVNVNFPPSLVFDLRSLPFGTYLT